ncbi:MAG: Sec-independent protein translocase protein TatB [Caulobacterales bacterium]
MFPEGRLFEFIIVGAVALMVVGPKDLPILMRRVGQFVARIRGMAAEFRASFDELARQSELDELRKEVEAMRAARPMDIAAGAAKSAGVSDVFTDIRQGLSETSAALDPQLTPPPQTPLAPEPAPPAASAAPLVEAAAKPKRVRKPKATTS